MVYNCSFPINLYFQRSLQFLHLRLNFTTTWNPLNISRWMELNKDIASFCTSGICHVKCWLTNCMPLIYVRAEEVRCRRGVMMSCFRVMVTSGDMTDIFTSSIIIVCSLIRCIYSCMFTYFLIQFPVVPCINCGDATVLKSIKLYRSVSNFVHLTPGYTLIRLDFYCKNR